MDRAKELFLKYNGNRFFMDREGDGSEYESYRVSKETEKEWAEEYISSFLKSGLRGREALRSYTAASELVRKDSGYKRLDALLYYPLKSADLDDVTVLFMLGASFRMAENAAIKGRFSTEDAERYLQELDIYIGDVLLRAEAGTLTRSEDYVMREFSDPVYVKEYLSGLKNKWKELCPKAAGG
jgi:hypothetical protein